MSKHKPDVIADDLPSGPVPPERNPDFTPLRSGEPWISPGIEDVLPLTAVSVARTNPDGTHDHAAEPRWHEIATMVC